MTQHAFGGIWTQKKLNILSEYLGFYTHALSGTTFRLIYIDAFAGTGRCTIQVKGNAQTIKGSAHIALDASPAFKELYFIEKKPKHAQQLRELLASHSTGNRAHVVEGVAANELKAVLDRQNWVNTRGVLFLDPYGLQCDWEMIEMIANTKALDVFFLVSLSGVYRQATNNLKDADGHKKEALSKFLGTGNWQDELYVSQTDLFDSDDKTRHVDPSGLARYIKKRLEEPFAKVSEPVILYQEDISGKRGAPLFALYFAVSNPARSAVELASRVAKDIMSKLR